MQMKIMLSVKILNTNVELLKWLEIFFFFKKFFYLQVNGFSRRFNWNLIKFAMEYEEFPLFE